MTTQNIKSIYDEQCKHIKIDKKLINDISDYETHFINKNEDHINFFGGNLLGVHPVRFKKSDSDYWYDEILNIDDGLTSSQIKALPTLDPDWVRGTDVMNLSCLWLVHKFFNSNLSEIDKRTGMIETLMVLMSKFISSLMAHHFKYPTDKSTALATYTTLSLKYDIKKHGSWYAMLLARADDVIDKNGVHFKTIKEFDDDGDIQYMVTDIQGRLREVVKKLHTAFEIIRAQDAKILTTKVKINVEGEELISDLTREFTPYRRYMHEIVNNERLFIKEELLEIIYDAMSTMSPTLFYNTLEYIIFAYNKESDHLVHDFIDDVLTHAFEFLSQESVLWYRLDLASIILKLRAVYMSSRSTNALLMKLRDNGSEVIKRAVGNKHEALVAAIRTGLMLYVVLRTVSMRYYT